MLTTHLKQQSALQRPSFKKIQEIQANPPYLALKDRLSAMDSRHPTKTVCHWFRNKDLRVDDNTALYHAYQKAKQASRPLVTLYLYCPNALIEHGISTARFDFLRGTLKEVQSHLAGLHIPFVILTIDQLSDTQTTLLRWCRELGVSDLYANYEYEVDELRRDRQVVDTVGTEMNCCYYHDQCVIEPGTLLNQQKHPFQVYTHYYNAWIDLIKRSPSLAKTGAAFDPQPRSLQAPVAHLFDCAIPTPPDEKCFDSEQEKKALRALWPAGHTAALKKLDYFMHHHLKDYGSTRNCAAMDSTSRLSPYLAMGAISVRTILEKLTQYTQGSYEFSVSASGAGVFAWVRELVFREFYRQQLVTTPHLSMNTPQNPKFTQVRWEKDELGWKKWCDGKTGVPWIDAGMRQLKQEAYLHNRLRMNVASYLYHILLIDYQKGERYFADTLIDWDLANNTQGWSPSYTVFNPIRQAEKNDPNGDYIRKWVPELKQVKGKAIFDPYERLSPAEFGKLHYPKPHVNWVASKERAIARFKEALSQTGS